MSVLFLILFLSELVLLFFLSQLLTRLLSSVLLHLTRNNHVTIHTLSVIFLPGVIIHELAHMLAASLLFVPVGHIEFFPQIHGDYVKLGSVAIGRTDPLRRFVVGVAPVILGLTVITAAFFFYFSSFLPLPVFWKILLLLYLLFEVGNTMFSSRKDMEGAVAFLILLVIVSVLVWFVFHPSLEIITNVMAEIAPLAMKIDLILLFPLGIDIIICLTARYLLKQLYRR